MRPDNAWTLVAETESAILPTLAVTNKRSQGFYAEQVFKTLAAEKAGRRDAGRALSTAQKEFFAAVGLDPSRYDFHDGSGLSPLEPGRGGGRRDVPPRHGQAPVRRRLEVHSGRLRRARRDPPPPPPGSLMMGRVVAKTGSIKGVSTLAGYVTASSGKTYVFSILLNGGRVWDSNGHAYQDRILRALVRRG